MSTRSDGREGSALISCFLQLMRPTVKSSRSQLQEGKCNGAGFAGHPPHSKQCSAGWKSLSFSLKDALNLSCISCCLCGSEGAG